VRQLQTIRIIFVLQLQSTTCTTNNKQDSTDTIERKASIQPNITTGLARV